VSFLCLGEQLLGRAAGHCFQPRGPTAITRRLRQLSGLARAQTQHVVFLRAARGAGLLEEARAAAAEGAAAAGGDARRGGAVVVGGGGGGSGAGGGGNGRRGGAARAGGAAG